MSLTTNELTALVSYSFRDPLSNDLRMAAVEVLTELGFDANCYVDDNGNPRWSNFNKNGFDASLQAARDAHVTVAIISDMSSGWLVEESLLPGGNGITS